MDKKDKDVNMEGGIVSEPMVATMPLTELKEVDYSFGNRDFGYPHSLEELNAALDKADAQRNDPTKWISSVEFHNRLEQKYPWLG
jgi:hypothetical protein